MLASGSLVVVPTDTVYGLAADPRAVDAKGLIYKAKARDASKPIVLLVSNAGEVEKRGGILNARAKRLTDEFWPGALTIVVDTEESTQGFRVPDHPVILSLLELVGGALYVTSANRSGEDPARSARGAVDMLGGHVAASLDAGDLGSSEPSTVVRIDGETVTVLREGAIPLREIEKCVSG
jgi:tRNA threonylcarbamoyl adenosine modification protein (Sua5/YciO/YrdC/YwlC family)